MNVVKTDWDYTELAPYYNKRPGYCGEAIDRMCKIAGVGRGAQVCDVGAGTGHLTKALLDQGFFVAAVEPNDAMRKIGISVTAGRSVSWVVGTGEYTKQPSGSFDLVTFGSSFSTMNRSLALKETARILKPRGWFACMWNHRDLTDRLQNQIEEFIKTSLPGYTYGIRREDQSDVILNSGLFSASQHIESSFVVTITGEDYVNAWRSHATLQRQAGLAFSDIIKGIQRITSPHAILHVPYSTRLWISQLK